MTLSFAPIPRAAAVAVLADRLADRTAFVAVVPRDLTTAVAARLATTAEFTCYLDNGTNHVAQVEDMSLLAALVAVNDGLGVPTIGVFVVPKRIPAEVVGQALGQEIPADGSRDVLIVHGGGPIYWPSLFVDALTRVDPAAVATLRMNDLGSLS